MPDYSLNPMANDEGWPHIASDLRAENANLREQIERLMSDLVSRIKTIGEQGAEIERLQERCTAYKGQVEAGALEIERLTGEVAMLRATNERLTGVLRDAGLLHAYQQKRDTE